VTRQLARTDPLQSRALLFKPGQRLGWEFRERHKFIRAFREPAPPQPPPSDALHCEAQAAALDHRDRVKTVTRFGGGSVLVLLLLAVGGSPVPLVLAALVAVGCGGAVLGTLQRKTQAERAIEEVGARQTAAYEDACGAWEQRRLAFEAAEAERVGRLDEWGAALVPPRTQRLDVIGGTPRSREAFLTVLGSSTLPQRPVIVLDLTGDHVCESFANLAREAGVPVDLQLLPRDLARTTLLSGLEPAQMVSSLVESMHGDNMGPSRGDRSRDELLLNDLCEALGEDLSLARLAAGLRALRGDPDTAQVLTRREYNRIADELFSDESRRQDNPNLGRLLSFIHPLRHLGSARKVGEPAYLTCIALDDAGTSAGTELLKDLVLQWATRHVAKVRGNAPAVMVVGDERVKLLHMERLSEVAAGRGVQVTFLLSHLRDMARELVGAGAVGFMKLGNHVEAKEAAEFIGYGHKFEVSNLSRTIGGNESITVGRTDGGSTSQGTSLAEGINWSTNWGRSTSASRRPGDLTDIGSGPDSVTEGQSSGGSRGGSRTTTTSQTTGSNWSTTRQTAEGSNWNDQVAQQRVYEFTVEPGRLQAMDDFHLLFVERDQRGLATPRSVEFNPEIVTLDRMNMDALPELEPPEAVQKYARHDDPGGPHSGYDERDSYYQPSGYHRSATDGPYPLPDYARPGQPQPYFSPEQGGWPLPGQPPSYPGQPPHPGQQPPPRW